MVYKGPTNINHIPALCPVLLLFETTSPRGGDGDFLLQSEGGLVR